MCRLQNLRCLLFGDKSFSLFPFKFGKGFSFSVEKLFLIVSFQNDFLPLTEAWSGRPDSRRGSRGLDRASGKISKQGFDRTKLFHRKHSLFPRMKKFIQCYVARLCLVLINTCSRLLWAPRAVGSTLTGWMNLCRFGLLLFLFLNWRRYVRS